MPRGSPGSFSKYFGRAAASSTMNLSEAGGSISHGGRGAECVQGRENPPMSFGGGRFQNTAWPPGSLGVILLGETRNCRLNSSISGLPGGCVCDGDGGVKAGPLVNVKGEAAARHKSRSYTAQVYSRDI